MFKKFFPSVDVLLQMQPEAIAPHFLMFLNDYVTTNKRETFHMSHIINEDTTPFIEYAGQHGKAVSYIFAEVWGWLLAQNFLAPVPEGMNHGFVFITRRGKTITSEGDIKKFAHISLLPRTVLDPELDKKVWPSFIDGDFDTAIFAAFKEVEVRMRNTAGLDNTHLGVSLAREVFNPEHGQLTDKMSPDKGERVGYMELFAGSIGVFKNPNSHRPVNYDDPVTVVSLILFANTLLQIIEKRKPQAEKELNKPIRKPIF